MLSARRKHVLGVATEDSKPDGTVRLKLGRKYRESGSQAAVVKWLRARSDWMVMRLENAQKRTPAQASRDRALGMEGGAPDLVLMYKRVVIFLEMKDGVRGAVKPAQEAVHVQLRARGQIILIGHGEEDAIAKLERVAGLIDSGWPLGMIAE
jgi:hypothetical protein